MARPAGCTAGPCMYRDKYFEVEAVLDEVLGTEDVDGAGEGIVSDVRLAIAEAEKRGAVKALRAFARTFREYHEPTAHVLAGKVGSDLADRAHLIEHGEVSLEGVRIESGEVSI